MEQRQTPAQWARSTTFSRPVRWGEVESEALARTPPPTDDDLEQVVALEPRPRWGLIVPAMVVLLAAPLVVVAAVAAAGSAEPDGALRWLQVAQVAAVAAFVTGLAPVLLRWEIRRRGRFDLLVTGGTAAAALAALLLLQRVRLDDLGWAPPMVAVVALAGLVAFVVLLVTSRPGRRLPRTRAGDLSPLDRWRRAHRAQVLEIVVGRGVVDRHDVDVPAMVDMPLGSWGQLDRPDDPRVR